MKHIAVTGADRGGAILRAAVHTASSLSDEIATTTRTAVRSAYTKSRSDGTAAVWDKAGVYTRKLYARLATEQARFWKYDICAFDAAERRIVTAQLRLWDVDARLVAALEEGRAECAL